MIHLKKSGHGSFNFASCTQPLTTTQIVAQKAGMGIQHAFNGRIAVAHAQHCYQHPVPVTVKRKAHRNTFIRDIFATGMSVAL